MPTLVRLLTIVAVIAGLIYGAMSALVNLVQPVRRPVEVNVPLPQLDQPPARNAAGTP
ncbi:histidine kinase [Consotaella salsifontis]|uniref:Histidine kinase n=1 Tax=Consotaella salsifontis TaxID=1365950 RepID=A0A1T4QP00_9HYPH|nr:histidine kinase [Consotaella salsifontis]SKA04978.1 hypothetical protein SAMN05428963_105135 [Consotaella salsifontis]